MAGLKPPIRKAHHYFGNLNDLVQMLEIRDFPCTPRGAVYPVFQQIKKNTQPSWYSLFAIPLLSKSHPFYSISCKIQGVKYNGPYHSDTLSLALDHVMAAQGKFIYNKKISLFANGLQSILNNFNHTIAQPCQKNTCFTSAMPEMLSQHFQQRII